MTTQEQYHELSFYTWSHEGKEFIHQHIVDAFLAQSADSSTKVITLFFSLAGLYLFIEKNYTGRQVQLAHLEMASKTKDYIKIPLPDHRGDITVSEVLAATPGVERDEMIHQWCIAVWQAYSDQHDQVIALTEKLLEK